MTDHPEPLTVGGKVLHQWLSAEQRRLAHRLAEEFAREIGSPGGSPVRELGSITESTEENLRVLARSLHDRDVPGPADLAGPLTASAARRAGEGIPLDAVLSVCHASTMAAWRELVAEASAEDLPDVVTCAELTLGCLAGVDAAVAAAYLAERHLRDLDEHHHRHALLSALLRGDPPDDQARRAGLPLPRRFLVLHLRFGRHPSEDRPGAGGVMAGRHKIHRATGELARTAGEAVLALLDTSGGTVLIPDNTAEHNWAADETLVTRLGHAAGVEVTAGGVLAGPAEVPGAADQAADIAELAEAFGRGHGFYRLSDLMLEYQLTRPSPARAELGGLLAPLETHRDLLATLETYVRHGLNRRRTAAQLHVHPNTVDYRVRRAVTLTGLDPADPVQLQHIGAALIIRRLPDDHFGRPHRTPERPDGEGPWGPPQGT
ncbi:PucR family transcriptional regulator [Amycolatopsis samaneae]|uniref:PucR family transcriptional regulator n=1 Tax=Amycolatopsis samaneae TaxID=664691 RepID=A0ABW5GWS8_9PSEU